MIFSQFMMLQVPIILTYKFILFENWIINQKQKNVIDY